MKIEDFFEISHEPIYNFLKTYPYPFEALGRPLKEFIQKEIDSVPKDQRLLGNISPLAYVTGDVVVESGAVLEAFCYVEGPTYIAKGATIRHGAYIRGNTYVSSDAIVGHTTEVKGSIFLPGAKASHFAYVGDSILGAKCNLGAGTKLANLRFDKKNISFIYENKKYSTSLNKCGSILGDHVQTACNMVLNPGTAIIKGKWIYG